MRELDGCSAPTSLTPLLLDGGEEGAYLRPVTSPHAFQDVSPEEVQFDLGTGDEKGEDTKRGDDHVVDEGEFKADKFWEGGLRTFKGRSESKL